MNALKKLFKWIKSIRQIPKPLSKPLVKPKGRVAICVGHSRRGDKGAASLSGVTEWDYNSKVAECLGRLLKQRGFTSQVIDDYPKSTYRGAMDWLRSRTPTSKFDIILELHFNSFSDTKANGYEYLYMDESDEGEKLATALNESHLATSRWQAERGARPVRKGYRGYSFLSKVAPPAVICEPFFGSNPTEWKLLADGQEEIAEIYADGIEQYFEHA